MTEDEKNTYWTGFNSGLIGESLEEGVFGWGSHTELYVNSWKEGHEERNKP